MKREMTKAKAMIRLCVDVARYQLDHGRHFSVGAASIGIVMAIDGDAMADTGPEGHLIHDEWLPVWLC